MREYSFNTIGVRDELIKWLQDQAKATHFSKVVLGISGGKDSTVAAALCCRAFGKENVYGILMPNGVQTDIDDSIAVCKALGINYSTLNIKPIYDSFGISYNLSFEGKGKDMTKDALINLAPRIRMTLLRLFAQSNHHRLCGTGNFSEITVGYCTKDGDTSCDINPFGKLTSLEVVNIGLTLEEIPEKLVRKTPSDGLCGLSDEEKLGVKYEDIHKYIRSIPMDKEIWYKIHDMELKGLHKRTTTPTYIPSDSLIYKEV